MGGLTLPHTLQSNYTAFSAIFNLSSYEFKIFSFVKKAVAISQIFFCNLNVLLSYLNFLVY